MLGKLCGRNISSGFQALALLRIGSVLFAAFAGGTEFLGAAGAVMLWWQWLLLSSSTESASATASQSSSTPFSSSGPLPVSSSSASLTLLELDHRLLTLLRLGPPPVLEQRFLCAQPPPLELSEPGLGIGESKSLPPPMSCPAVSDSR
jgi:hypothetical protein